MSNSARRKRRPRWGRILGALFALAFIACALFVLPMLQKQGPGLTDPNSSDPAGQSDSLQTDVPVESEQTPSFADLGVSLEGLHYDSGLDGQHPANAQYAYFLQPLDPDDPNTQALARFDVTTNTLDWLCSTPGCDHRSPDCTAWVPRGLGHGVYLDGDDLYLLIRDIEDVDHPSISVYRCDLDGSDRTEIMHLEGEHSWPYLLFNEEAVVLSNTDGEQPGVYVYNKADGSCQHLTTRKLSPYSTKAPFYGHTLLAMVDLAPYTFACVAIDLATGQERTLHEFSSMDGDRNLVLPVVDDGYLYYLRDKSGEYGDLVRQSILSGEETVLNDSVFLPDNYTSGIYLEAQDGCYIYSLALMSDHLTDEDFTTYCLDLATGAPTELPPSFNINCSRVAVFGDYYLVNTITGNMVNSRDLRLISIADYEAGNENYIAIQDNTL